MEVADIGCGVGGPLITIARATGARITGINFNAHQVRRGERNARRAGLGNSCRFLHADFMNVPLDDGAFDAIYAFESLCHAPNKRLAFRELFRLLKPGGRAAIVDWCLTDEFDGANAQHDGLRARIEKGNAVTELMTTKEQLDAMQQAGFKVTNAFDQQAEFGNPQRPGTWRFRVETCHCPHSPAFPRDVPPPSGLPDGSNACASSRRARPKPPSF